MPGDDSPSDPPPAEGASVADELAPPPPEDFGRARAIFLVLATIAVLVPLAWGLIVLAQSPSTPSSALSDIPAPPVRLEDGATGYVVAPPNASQSWLITILTVPTGGLPQAALPQPASGYRWTGFEVEVTGDGVDAVGQLSWTATDTLGIERMRAVFNPPSPAAEELMYGLLEPGETASGWVYFEIPDNATIRQLRIEPAVFGGDPLVFAVD